MRQTTFQRFSSSARSSEIDKITLNIRLLPQRKHTTSSLKDCLMQLVQILDVYFGNSKIKIHFADKTESCRLLKHVVCIITNSIQKVQD